MKILFINICISIFVRDIHSLREAIFAHQISEACPNGTFGLNCAERCPEGRYGSDCEQICKCRPDEVCSPISGCEESSTVFKITTEKKVAISISVAAIMGASLLGVVACKRYHLWHNISGEESNCSCTDNLGRCLARILTPWQRTSEATDNATAVTVQDKKEDCHLNLQPQSLEGEQVHNKSSLTCVAAYDTAAFYCKDDADYHRLQLRLGEQVYIGKNIDDSRVENDYEEMEVIVH